MGSRRAIKAGESLRFTSVTLAPIPPSTSTAARPHHRWRRRRRAAATAPASGRADAGPSRKSDAAERAAAEGQVRVLMAATAATRSGDSLESILRIDLVAEYGRLALWMVDASAEEIGTNRSRDAGRPRIRRDSPHGGSSKGEARA